MSHVCIEILVAVNIKIMFPGIWFHVVW